MKMHKKIKRKQLQLQKRKIKNDCLLLETKN